MAQSKLGTAIVESLLHLVAEAHLMQYGAGVVQETIMGAEESRSNLGARQRQLETLSGRSGRGVSHGSDTWGRDFPDHHAAAEVDQMG